jgi:predicted DNA-binding protein with PD1-like motif
MNLAESRHSRRLVGRVPRGVDLLTALVDVCKTHRVRAGEIRAQGALEQAVLAEYDQRNRTLRSPRRFDAQLDIVHFHATIGERDGQPSLVARVALSRERDNGIELLGGQLLGGRVFAAEIIIDVFEDLRLPRELDAGTGLWLWSRGVPVAVESSVPATATACELRETPAPAANPFAESARTVAVPHVEPTGTTWSDVVAASAASTPKEAPEPEDAPVAPARPPSMEEVRVVAGDWIEHPKFGRCQVERVEGDYEFVSVRLRNQRLIRLSLDVLELLPVGEEPGGRRLFRAERA